MTSRNQRRIVFSFMKVEFVKETKMPKSYEKFLRIVAQIYLLNQFKDFTCDDLEFIYKSSSSEEKSFSDEQEYEKFRMFANDENDDSEIEVKITFKQEEADKRDQISEYRQAMEIEKVPMYEEYVKTVMNKSIEEFKKNLEILLCIKNITNLQVRMINCDECKHEPLRGNVYKCFICDPCKTICEECSLRHKHPLLRQKDMREEADKLPIQFEEYIKYVIENEKIKLQERIIQEIINLSKYDANKSKNETVKNVKCSGGCKSTTIKGRTFCCVICSNATFCEKCSDKHEHPMIVE